MKKFSYLFACVAIAVAGVLVSCSKSDDSVSAPKITSNVVLEDFDAYVLEASSNVSATFTVGNESKTGTEVEFITPDKSITVPVKADGYLDQTAEVNFSDLMRVTWIYVEMFKPSTNLVAQEDAKGKTIGNDEANEKATGAKVELEVPADLNISGNTTDPFSVTAFKPAPKTIPLESLKVNQKLKASILGLLCKPDGATFDKPLTLSVTMDDLKDLDIEVPDASDVKLNGNTLSFQVSHFSIYDILMNGTIESLTKGEKEVYNNTVLINKGENKVDVSINVGYESDSKIEEVQQYLTYLFGTPLKKLSKNVVFTADGFGSANIVIRQAYYDVTFSYGNIKASARIWAEPACTVTTSANTSIHSGGSIR